jgi:hypothetical protein
MIQDLYFWRSLCSPKKVRYPCAEEKKTMSQVAKQYIRVVTIVLAAALLFALLLALRSTSPSQAAHLGPIASSSSVGDDILPESGAYHGAVISSLEQIEAFECMVGKKLSVVKVYQHFHNEDFYQNWADFIHDHGAIEFLSFDPTIHVHPSPDITKSLDLTSCAVLSGDYDSTIIAFAQHIKSWGQPLLLSFAGEMNGNWAGWSGAKNFGPNCITYTEYTEVADLYTYYGCTNTDQITCADGPERYRDIYTHVYNIFASEEVTNVTWVWVVNHESFPNESSYPWNHPDNYYPGDEYVDVISVDGYNWGDDGPGGCPVDAGWKTFDEIFGAVLTSLSNTHPTKPFMLGEFASVEGTDPMSKANWITDAYNHVKTDWPQIKAAIWFNLLSDDCHFQVESSPESVQAYREAITDSYFIGDRVWCSYLPLVCKSYSPTSFCTNSGSGGTETIEVEPPRTIGGIHIDLIERALKQYGFSLWEVEIYGPDTSNLAIGATATASSSQDSYGCYECFPEKAIDGRMDTRWGSDFYEPQWLEITLPTPHVVNRIVLKWEAAYAKEYCVTVIE